MQGEEDPSPPHCGKESQEAEEPAKAVYFVPLYAVAIVDPNKHAPKSHPSPEAQRQESVCRESVSRSKGMRSKAAEAEATVQHKRQKLVVMRKRGRIPVYDDDDPHKPTPKRLRNRMKAQRSRDKKKAYVNALESRVEELGKMNSELEARCCALQTENESMKNQIMDAGPAAQDELMHCHEVIREQRENNAPSLSKIPGHSRETRDCALEKFVCGSDADGSPSRYIDDNDDHDHDDVSDHQYAERNRIPPAGSMSWTAGDRKAYKI